MKVHFHNTPASYHLSFGSAGTVGHHKHIRLLSAHIRKHLKRHIVLFSQVACLEHDWEDFNSNFHSHELKHKWAIAPAQCHYA